uniref:Unannotated protein n=1 Tax=freshwater metagenome TaxID=449393 RepID=A0A6J7QCT4_9ZZZZ
MQGAVRSVGHGKRGLRLEERVLNSLRVEGLSHEVGSGRECGIHITPPVLTDTQHVRVRAPHRNVLRERGGDSDIGVGDGRVHEVLHAHEVRCSTCLLTGVGHDDGEHVAGVARAAALGDEDRPVLVDDADAQFARDVGGGVHDVDARGSLCRGRVDVQDVRSAVGREVQRRVQHALHAEVVDVAAIPECELLGLVADPARPDTAGDLRCADRSFGHALDGVEHLHVSGAATQVCAEVPCHVRAIEVGALLVHLGLRAHHDPRDAEAALQSAARRERVGVCLPLGLVDTLEREHRLANNLGERLLAGDDCLAVNMDGAATALAGRRAAILRGSDVQLVPEGRQQVWMIAAHLYGYTVDDKTDRLDHVDILSKHRAIPVIPRPERRGISPAGRHRAGP